MFNHRKILLALAVSVAALAWAQAPNNTGGYYASANGFKGKTLKTKLYQIIGTPQVTSYNGLWKTYYTSDKRPDGKVWDMYSNTTSYRLGQDQAGSYSKEGDVYNREHSFPKSWFNDQSPMYSDAMHIVPSDGYVNGKRSNWPFGENNGEKYKSHNGFSKLGNCTTPGGSGTVFEPADEYKGDFARIYFYMATAYEAAITNWNSSILQRDEYRPYVKWQMDMLMRWAKEDPVSQKEILRNNAVYAVQKNRNPFVDYPGLEVYIWGDSTEVAFSYDNYASPIPANLNGIGGVYPGSENANPTDPTEPTTDPTEPTDPTTDTNTRTFKKVTDESQLEIGKQYLIVCESKNVALGEQVKAKNEYRKHIGITISGDQITTAVDASDKPHQLTLDGKAGAYSLYDASAKQYLMINSDKNTLQSSADVFNKWEILIYNGSAQISTNGRLISYNSDAPRFACYKTQQNVVQLYKFDPVATAITSASAAPPKADGYVYSVSGQRIGTAEAVSTLPRGIYILNGKKFVVR